MGEAKASRRPGEQRPPVMEDVAELAGVSAMTVSRVLNSPDKVRAATRARVMAAVRELGYRPNPAARHLVTGRSGVLGVVSFDTTLYGPASTLYGIERAAREHDYLINIVSLSTLNRRSIGEGVERLRGQSVDGVVIVAPHESAADGLRDLPPDLPIVVVGGGDGLPFPMASVDQRSGAMRVTRHLLNLGHETVWHLSGPADWIDANGRIAGWREVLRAERRAAPDHLVGDWSTQSGYDIGARIARDPAVTAVFAANDAMAFGLLRALREAGRRVPEDISVAGFDDVPESAFFSPPLTTVRQNFRDVGRHAFTLLLDRIGEPGGDGAPGRRVIRPELIIRDSTTAAHRP